MTPYIIRCAYEQGLFPMGMDDGEIGWFEPRERALFPIEGIRISRSLRRLLKKVSFERNGALDRLEVTFDTAFEKVIRGCLRPCDNWITEEIIQVFTQVHLEGWAHSCEVWRGETLVGGIYGVAIGRVFSAESMFHRETNASKVALWAMVEKCRQLGFTTFDAQIMNPHLASLGAYEMGELEYLRLLRREKLGKTVWS